MSRKSDYLQIRVTRDQKAALKRAAQRAGQGMSAFVLERLLPPVGLRFEELLRALSDNQDRRYALAELNDLLTDLTPAEFPLAVAAPPLSELSPYMRNYVAAMVEQAAHQKGIAPPPDWLADIEPLEQPRFVDTLAGLRLHLLASSPVPFRRRNIFLDSTVGDRV